eukprot:637066-Hanusia_phi.AAC.1
MATSENDAEEEHNVEETSALTIQRVVRGRAGRLKAKARREDERLHGVKTTGWNFNRMQSILSSSVLLDPPPPLNPSRSSVDVSESLSKTIFDQYDGDKDDDGRMSGSGRALLQQGTTYEGEWSKGLMHGTGCMQWKDGTTYRGPLEHARLVGKGQLRWPGGHAYDGEMVDGYRHGKGRLVMTDANEQDESAVVTYDGEWQHGKRHGHGVLLYDSDGKQRYDGEWRNNLRHGRGTMLYKSGNQYTGEEAGGG